jgi:endonuclease/exonuclease/phosphatase family metal-dependent hydrolase
MRKAFVLAALVTALVAPAADAARRPPTPAPTITVMTQNLYVGFDVQTLLAVSGGTLTDFVSATTAAWQAVRASDPTGRMSVVAAQIAARKPDLVGLQEAANYTSLNSGSYDFVQLVIGALAQRGLRYTVVASATNASVVVPIVGGEFVQFSDRDVLLARTGKGAKKLTITAKRSGNYTDTTVVATPAGPVPFPRGWTSANVTVSRHSFHIVETHLEAFNDTRQVAQAKELIAGPAASKLPTILLGDLNTNGNPGINQTETYPDLVAAGFVDAWKTLRPADPGLTCCHPPDLREPVPTFKQRLDLVLARGRFKPLSAAVVGTAPADRTPSGLWGSDHAGVAMTLRVP